MHPVSHAATERLILALGYGGLLPFAGLALLMWLVDSDLVPFVALALQGYGAAIVSFLGGIHWGVGLRYAATHTEGHRFHLVWGVAPALLAWVALLMPAYAGLPALAAVLALCYLVDRRTWAGAGLAQWLPLRFRLTLVAGLSCLLGAAAT